MNAAPGAGNPSDAIRSASQESERLLRVATTAFERIGDLITDVGASVKDLNKDVKETGKAADKVSKKFKGVTNDVSELSGRLEKVKGNVEKLGMEKGLSAKKMKQFIDEADKLKFFISKLKNIKDLNEGKVWDPAEAQDFLKTIQEEGIEVEKYGLALEDIENLNETAWNEEFIEKVTKAMREADREVRQMETDLETVKDSFIAFGKQSTAPAVAEWTEGFGTMKAMAGSLKGTPKNMMMQAKQAGIMADRFKMMGGSLTKMGGMGKMLGGLFKGMGGTIGGISKLLGGWPGLIAMAVVKVVDMAMKIDKFVKDANKAFASVRGPDIMTKDIAGQFKNFNDQIYRIRDNLEVGLNVDQIREFMSSVSQAGLQVQSFNDGINDYRTAIYTAAKASKTLGIELPQVGAMIADLTTNFKMDIEEVDKAFVQVAFDAKKSGLTTDRFWQAIQNASNGLAFYGKFLDAASRSMKALTEAQITGAEDAAGATQEMYQLFKKNSYGVNAALIEFAEKSGKSLDERFTEAAAAATQEVEGLKGKLSTAIELNTDPAQVEKLRKQIATAEDKQARLTGMIGKNSVEQATELAMLTDQTPELLMDVIKTVSGVKNVAEFDATKSEHASEKLILAMEAMEKFGVSKDVVRTLITQQTTANRELENIFKLTGDSNTDQKAFATKFIGADAATRKKVVDGLGKLTSKVKEGNTEREMTDDEISTMMSFQTKNLQKSLGIDEGMARTIVEAAASDKGFNSDLTALLSTQDMSSEDIAKSTAELVNKYKLGEKVARQRHRLDDKGQDEMASAAKDTFDEIVNQTFSAEEAAKITKDGLKWQAVSAIGVTEMAAGVTDIIRLMAKGGKTPEEKRLYKSISSASGKKVESKKDLVDAYKGAMKDTPILENSVKRLEDQLKELDAAVITAEDDSIREEKKKARDEKRRELTNAKNALAKSKEIADNTMKLVDINDDLRQDFMYMLASNEDASAAVIESIMSSADKGMTKDELYAAMRKKGLAPEFGKVQQVMNKMLNKNEKGEYTLKAGTAPSDQGLTTPQIVTKPGAVVLHPEEMILPKNLTGFSAMDMAPKVKPLGAPESVGAGAPVSKNINITVNATETNLANKIANEIRSVLYKDQLAGVA